MSDGDGSTGASFGDNILAALPDIIGQTIGSAVAERIAAGAQRRGLSQAGAALGGGASAASSLALIEELALTGAPLSDLSGLPGPSLAPLSGRSASAGAGMVAGDAGLDELNIVVTARRAPRYKNGPNAGELIGRVNYVREAAPTVQKDGRFGIHVGAPGEDASFVDYGSPLKYFGGILSEIGSSAYNNFSTAIGQVMLGLGDTAQDMLNSGIVGMDAYLAVHGDLHAMERTKQRVGGVFSALASADYRNTLLALEAPFAAAADSFILRDDVRGISHIASSSAAGGVSARLTAGLSRLGVGGVKVAETAPIDIAANEAAWARAAAEAEGPYSLVGANRAVIDPRKLTDYALNPAHPVGGNKARVFESAFGFNSGNADNLMLQLREGVMSTPATIGKIDQYGTRFTVDIPVRGPTGSGSVRTGWIYRPGSNTPELTTLFPK